MLLPISTLLWRISPLLRRIPALLRWALPIPLLGLLTVALLWREAARLLSISLRRLARLAILALRRLAVSAWWRGTILAGSTVTWLRSVRLLIFAVIRWIDGSQEKFDNLE